MRGLVWRMAVVTMAAVLVALPAVAQETPTAFPTLERHLKAQGGYWALNNRRVAAAFNVDRKRLGDKFVPELMRYLGDDPEKHYWIASYLSSDYYLQGSKPMPYLARLISEQGIHLCRAKGTQDARAQEVSLSVVAAVESYHLGLAHLACVHKTRAEFLMKREPILVGAMPAMTEENHKVYDGIKLLKAPAVAADAKKEGD